MKVSDVLFRASNIARTGWTRLAYRRQFETGLVSVYDKNVYPTCYCALGAIDAAVGQIKQLDMKPRLNMVTQVTRCFATYLSEHSMLREKHRSTEDDEEVTMWNDALPLNDESRHHVAYHLCQAGLEAQARGE